MSWLRIPLPEVPAEDRDRFVAHSVTATNDPTNIFARSFSWNELKDADRIEEDGHARGNIISNISELRDFGVEYLPQYWRVYPDDVLVTFGSGTFVLCNPKASDLAFSGFTTADSPYYIPIHRLPNGRSSGRKLLFEAQQRLDELPTKDAAGAKAALSILMQARYPLPGTDFADANVIALWRQENTINYMALVECKCFQGVSGQLGVLVSFESLDKVPYEALREIADAGRDCFRYDLLGPHIANVHVAGPPQ